MPIPLLSLAPAMRVDYLRRVKVVCDDLRDDSSTKGGAVLLAGLDEHNPQLLPQNQR